MTERADELHAEGSTLLVNMLKRHGLSKPYARDTHASLCPRTTWWFKCVRKHIHITELLRMQLGAIYNVVAKSACQVETAITAQCSCNLVRTCSRSLRTSWWTPPMSTQYGEVSVCRTTSIPQPKPRFYLNWRGMTNPKNVWMRRTLWNIKIRRLPRKHEPQYSCINISIRWMMLVHATPKALQTRQIRALVASCPQQNIAAAAGTLTQTGQHRIIHSGGCNSKAQPWSKNYRSMM